MQTKTQLRRQINRFRKEMGMGPIVKKKRECLGCEKQFPSDGIWNRLCESCTLKQCVGED